MLVFDFCWKFEWSALPSRPKQYLKMMLVLLRSIPVRSMTSSLSVMVRERAEARETFTQLGNSTMMGLWTLFFLLMLSAGGNLILLRNLSLTSS